MSARSPMRSPSGSRAATPLPSRYIPAVPSKRHALPRSSRMRARWKSWHTISRTRPSSMPHRAARATGCATSCSTTRRAPTASIAGCSPRTSTSTEPSSGPAPEAARSATPGAGRPSRLLCERVGRGLPVLHVLVRDIERLAILGRGEVDLIRHPAHAVVGLLDGVVIDFLQLHPGVSRVANHRILLAIELGVITLPVPFHRESLGAHRVVDDAGGAVGLRHTA